MNLLIEFTKISKNLTATSKVKANTGRKSSPFQEHVSQSSAIGNLHAQILSVSLL